jgi:arginyl-tRNA synthetase
MSKRAGDFISVQDLLNEVDKDPIRFMMLNRSNDVELDFDFDKVKIKTKDNPVFYVQYAYARINSLHRALNINLNSKISLNEQNFALNSKEEKIIRKIFEWPKISKYTKSHFIYMNYQLYFIHIGAKETKMISINL